MRLTIVGGGSTYTPELVDGLVRTGLDVTEIALQDVSSQRLTVLAAMSRRMLAAGGHPAKVTGLIANVTAYEHLALDAAVRGGRDRVFRALLAHPLVGQYAVADRLTDLLLSANRPYLPWAG
jgi:alpha-galactosidase/6-phospho-beta-glucosidase family protein